MKNKEVVEQKEDIDYKILNMLRNFQSAGKFRNEVLKIIVNMMNEDEIKGLKKTFQALDKKNTGKIGVQVLKKVLILDY